MRLIKRRLVLSDYNSPVEAVPTSRFQTIQVFNTHNQKVLFFFRWQQGRNWRRFFPVVETINCKLQYTMQSACLFLKTSTKSLSEWSNIEHSDVTKHVCVCWEGTIKSWMHSVRQMITNWFSTKQKAVSMARKERAETCALYQELKMNQTKKKCSDTERVCVRQGRQRPTDGNGWSAIECSSSAVCVSTYV